MGRPAGWMMQLTSRSAICHPTTIRVARSMTVARYSQPWPVRRNVMPPSSLMPGSSDVKSARSGRPDTRHRSRARPRAGTRVAARPSGPARASGRRPGRRCTHARGRSAPGRYAGTRTPAGTPRTPRPRGPRAPRGARRSPSPRGLATRRSSTSEPSAGRTSTRSDSSPSPPRSTRSARLRLRPCEEGRCFF